MHSRQRPPDLLVLLRWVDGFTSISSLARSLAEKKRTSVAAAAVWRPNSLIYYPSSLCVSPRCGGRADGGLSLFAKSTCNFRMFSRRPPSSSFFPFFVCSPFLQKRFNGRSTTPARSLARYFLRPVSFFVPLRFAKGTPVKLPVVPTRCASVFLRAELESLEL